MIFDFAAVKRSLQGLEARLASLRSEIRGLQQKREAAHNAPTSRDDVKAMFASWINAAGDEYTNTLQESIEKMARNPSAMANPFRVMQLASFGAATLPYQHAETDPREIGMAMCGLFGKVIHEALTKAVDAMDWPANATSAAQRAADIEELEARIAKLQAEEREIVGSASDVGINL